MARQELSKKRSLHQVNEHFETIFNAVMAKKMLRAKLSTYNYLLPGIAHTCSNGIDAAQQGIEPLLTFLFAERFITVAF